MRRIVTTLLLSLILMTGTGVAFADKHNGHGHDRDKKEYRQDRHKPGNGHNGKHDRHDKKHHDKDRYDHDRYGRHDYNSYRRPGHQPRVYYRPTPPGHSYHHNLAKMVRHAARGAQDVMVWMISDDTYIVKFRRGNRYYTQYLYPYSGRYGHRNNISVHWMPQSPWTLIPSINLNIDL